MNVFVRKEDREKEDREEKRDTVDKEKTQLDHHNPESTFLLMLHSFLSFFHPPLQLVTIFAGLTSETKWATRWREKRRWKRKREKIKRTWERRPESSLKENTIKGGWMKKRIKIFSLSTFDSFSSPTVILSLVACRSPFFDGINYKDCIRPHEYTSQILSSFDYLPLSLSFSL